MSDTRYKATHRDPITTQLRDAWWQPSERMPCGCNPTALCYQHREIRAIEHYHTELIP